MKYRRLPLETELASVPNEKTRREIMEGAALETFRTRGFQFVTIILRDLEARALNALRSSLVPVEKVGQCLGRLECIEEFRRSLTALLPEQQRTNVDWMEDEEEAWVNLSHSTPTDDDNG